MMIIEWPIAAVIITISISVSGLILRYINTRPKQVPSNVEEDVEELQESVKELQKRAEKLEKAVIKFEAKLENVEFCLKEVKRSVSKIDSKFDQLILHIKGLS